MGVPVVNVGSVSADAGGIAGKSGEVRVRPGKEKEPLLHYRDRVAVDRGIRRLRAPGSDATGLSLVHFVV